MSKRNSAPVSVFTLMLIAVFGVAGSALAFTAATGNPIFTAITHADDGEDQNENENESEDENEDENEDKESEAEKKEQEIKKEQEKKAKEAAKKKAEYQREALKKKAEFLREQAKKRDEFKREQLGDDDDGIEDEDENEDESEDENDEKTEEDKADILEDINEEIIKAEERINRAQAEGIDVTKALATLADAKAKARAAEATLATASYEELRRVSREVKKLAHFASHKDVKSARDIEKDVDKIGKRIAQAKGKISLYESLGGDGNGYTSVLASLEAEFTSLKSALAAGGQEQINALALLDPLERKIKSLKSGVESAIYAIGGTDERYDDDYENETEDIFEDLSDVAEIEGDELGAKIKSIALAQKEGAVTVSKSVEALDKRNRVLQFLFGTNGSAVSKLEAEIAANQARIVDLTQAAASIEDPEVKAILEEQIESLKTETGKLQTFVSGQKARPSTFGWFFDLF